jgi:hypothetical protein
VSSLGGEGRLEIEIAEVLFLDGMRRYAFEFLEVEIEHAEGAVGGCCINGEAVPRPFVRLVRSR